METAVDRVVSVATAARSERKGVADVVAEIGERPWALQGAAGNRTVAARILGISRRTLYNKLAEHKLV